MFLLNKRLTSLMPTIFIFILSRTQDALLAGNMYSPSKASDTGTRCCDFSLNSAGAASSPKQRLRRERRRDVAIRIISDSTEHKAKHHHSAHISIPQIYFSKAMMQWPFGVKFLNFVKVYVKPVSKRYACNMCTFITFVFTSFENLLC